MPLRRAPWSARPSLLLAFSAAFSALAWAQTPPYQGALLISPGANGAKCLRADNVDGSPVTVADCAGSSDQLWTFTNGQVQLYTGGKCLDVIGGANVDGTKLQVWDCGAASVANQQFEYTAYGDNHIAWATTGKCLDLTNGNMTNGNQVQVYGCSGAEDANNQIWDTGYMYNALPTASEVGQAGTNACGNGSSQTSMCQTMWLNDADDFCLWAPPTVGTIGDTEREEVAWCVKGGYGTRVMPDGTLTGVHFVRTPDYVQVTGVGDLTKINVAAGDGGGELDPHGSDSNGNPIGGLVYGNTFGANQQYHEWASFISDGLFCMRACTGPNARENCQHTFDEMGCYWNMPANYDDGYVESCQGDNDLPMGVYGTSTWSQGVSPTPSAHPVASSSSCTTFPSITSAPAKRALKRERLVRRTPGAPSPSR